MSVSTSGSDRVLLAIIELTADKGYPPTIREIGDHVGLSSTSTVHAQLQRLVRQGRISHDPSKPRTIQVLNLRVVN